MSCASRRPIHDGITSSSLPCTISTGSRSDGASAAVSKRSRTSSETGRNGASCVAISRIEVYGEISTSRAASPRAASSAATPVPSEWASSTERSRGTPSGPCKYASATPAAATIEAREGAPGETP